MRIFLSPKDAEQRSILGHLSTKTDEAFQPKAEGVFILDYSYQLLAADKTEGIHHQRPLMH